MIKISYSDRSISFDEKPNKPRKLNTGEKQYLDIGKNTWNITKFTVMDSSRNSTFGQTFKTDPQLSFVNVKIGELFNYYQDIVTTLKWDIRYNGEIPVVTLARDHMFIAEHSINLEKVKQFLEQPNNDFLLKFIITNAKFQQEKQLFSLTVLEKAFGLNAVINKDDISKIEYEYSYEQDPNMYNAMKEIDKENFDNDYLYRNTYRKMSENFFAISGYNLIYQEISVNNEVPNVITIFDEKNQKETETKLFIIPKDYEKLTDSEKQLFNYNKKVISTTNEKFTKTRNDFNKPFASEYLATQMIKELSYSYQGKIYIMFNGDIEIGDTITLMDHVTSTFGIFEVDAFEHSFDERGLITILYVKAKIQHLDPFLDCYAIKMGYEIANDFNEKYISYGNSFGSLSNIKLKNIFANYIKHIVQAPKYISFSIANGQKDIIDYRGHNLNIQNQFLPKMPVCFYPLMKNNKMLYPKTLECAFFGQNLDIINNILLRFFKGMLDSIRHGFWSGTEWATSVMLYIGDFAVNTLTLGISDLFKTVLGINQGKAFKEMISNNFEYSDETVKIISEYDPHSGKYNVGNFDFTIGFFNIQGQNVADMFESREMLKNNKLNITDADVLKKISYKTGIINKIISQTFDLGLIVEMYDTFEYKKLYNAENLLNDIVPKNVQHEEFEVMKNKLKSSTSTEYTVITKNSKIKKVNDTMQIDLANQRKATFVTLDIEEYGYKDIKQLHVAWFHNLFGEKNITTRNVINERIDNVKTLIDYFNEKIDKNTAVIIVGDFNLNIYNYGENPINGSASHINEVYELPELSKFVAMNKRKTTLNSSGEPKGNAYDNALVSKNIKKFVKVFPFIYPVDNSKNRKIVSDHIPLIIGFNDRDYIKEIKEYYNNAK